MGSAAISACASSRARLNNGCGQRSPSELAAFSSRGLRGTDITSRLLQVHLFKPSVVLPRSDRSRYSWACRVTSAVPGEKPPRLYATAKLVQPGNTEAIGVHNHQRVVRHVYTHFNNSGAYQNIHSPRSNAAITAAFFPSIRPCRLGNRSSQR